MFHFVKPVYEVKPLESLEVAVCLSIADAMPGSKCAQTAVIILYSIFSLFLAHFFYLTDYKDSVFVCILNEKGIVFIVTSILRPAEGSQGRTQWGTGLPGEPAMKKNRAGRDSAGQISVFHRPAAAHFFTGSTATSSMVTLTLVPSTRSFHRP